MEELIIPGTGPLGRLGDPPATRPTAHSIFYEMRVSRSPLGSER
jgi:hypothetical protein